MIKKVFFIIGIFMLLFFINRMTVKADRSNICIYKGSFSYYGFVFSEDQGWEVKLVTEPLSFKITFSVELGNEQNYSVYIEYIGTKSWHDYEVHRQFNVIQPEIKITKGTISSYLNKCPSKIWYKYSDVKTEPRGGSGAAAYHYNRTYTIYDEEIIDPKGEYIEYDDDGSKPFESPKGQKTCVYKSNFDSIHLVYDGSNNDSKVVVSNNISKIQFDDIANVFIFTEDGKIICRECVTITSNFDWGGANKSAHYINTLYNTCDKDFDNDDVEVKKYYLHDSYDSFDKDKYGIPDPSILKPIPIECEDFYYVEKDGNGNIIRSGNIIKEIYSIIMIIAPILVIVLGSLDFAKATLAADDEAMKKSQINFLRRIIAAIILFLLPYVVSIMLGLAYNSGIPVPTPIICILG